MSLIFILAVGVVPFPAGRRHRAWYVLLLGAALAATALLVFIAMLRSHT